MRHDRLQNRAASRMRASLLRGAIVLASGAALVACFGSGAFAKGTGLPSPFLPAAARTPAAALDRARATALLHPDDPSAGYELARACLAADSSAQAEQALLAVLEHAPQHAPSLALLSKLEFDTGRHAQAVERLAAVREHPESFAPAERAALLTGLALHHEALGAAAAARAVLSEVQRLNQAPRSAEVYFALLGDHPESAEAAAEQALRNSPRSAVDLNNFGITRLRRGAVDEARQSFLSAIERDALLPGPYYNLAILEKFYRFDDDAAARWLAAYRERSSADPDSLFGAMPSGNVRPLAGKGQQP